MIPFISFVIPAFNESAVIGRCIRRIRLAWPNAQIIVVDNNSTDDTAAKASGADMVIKESTKGVTHARQAGLVMARSEWVVFIDADNEVPFEWMLAFLMHGKDPKVVGVTGPLVYPELGRWQSLMVRAFYRVGSWFHRVMPMMQGGNFVVRKSAMMAAGGFPLDVAFYGEDTETAVRLSEQGRIVWERGLWCNSSARRFRAEGFIFSGARYMMNYLSVWILRRPFNSTYLDHRSEP